MLLLSKKNHVGTRGTWASAWGQGTPPAHTLCLGYASMLGTSQRTHGAWAPASVVSTPLRTRDADLLSQCWAHLLLTRGAWAPASILGIPLRTRGAWAVCLRAGHTPAHMWRLGTLRSKYPGAPHSAEPEIALSHWLYMTQNRLDSNSIGSCYYHNLISYENKR